MSRRNRHLKEKAAGLALVLAPLAPAAAGMPELAVAVGIVVGVLVFGLWGDRVVGALIMAIPALFGAGAALGRHALRGPATRRQRSVRISSAAAPRRRAWGRRSHPAA